MSIDYLLPSNCPADKVRKRIGLVSDTHSPQRCQTLPAALFTALAGADLILHAGDVGDLTVLDQLSQIAPVIAVHGNDDSQEAIRELPEQQIVTISGIRILLWHSHYLDRDEEMADRQFDEMRPKLNRIGERAEQAYAEIAVFGHWHIPLCYRYKHDQNGSDAIQENYLPNKCIRLINPGAIASPNEITRQLRQTCAALFIDEQGTAFVSHVNLASPKSAYRSRIDWDAGFSTAGNHYCASILAEDLADQIPYLRSNLAVPLTAALRTLVLRLAHRCWRGEIELITRHHLLQELANDQTLPATKREQLTHLLMHK